MKMAGNWKNRWRSQSKSKLQILKLGVGAIVAALIVRLIFSRSIDVPQVAQTGIIILEDMVPDQTVDTRDERDVGQCDLFHGDWVRTRSGPVYTNESCPFIEDDQNCLMNGRPDTNYLYWRWNPRGCSLPQFNARRFLELMRDKTWGLIGDSVSRNHAQSFLCILSQIERAVDVYHDKDYKSRRWFFPSFNFSLSAIWSPFLAEASIFEDINGVSSSEIELHLDRLDKNWTQQFNGLDYVVFSSGLWFMKPAVYIKNGTLIGCHHCPKRDLKELGFGFAYGEILRNLFNRVVSSKHRGMVFFRTSTPDHFENGQWFTGGKCERKEPVHEGEFELSEVNRILRDVELEEFKKVSAMATDNGVKLKLFDVNPLSLLRPDGHPGPYRFFQPFADGKNKTYINDCLHWCLPGPIDSWNDLLMEMVIRSG